MRSASASSVRTTRELTRELRVLRDAPLWALGLGYLNKSLSKSLGAAGFFVVWKVLFLFLRGFTRTPAISVFDDFILLAYAAALDLDLEPEDYWHINTCLSRRES